MARRPQYLFVGGPMHGQMHGVTNGIEEYVYVVNGTSDPDRVWRGHTRHLYNRRLLTWPVGWPQPHTYYGRHAFIHSSVVDHWHRFVHALATWFITQGDMLAPIAVDDPVRESTLDPEVSA